MALQGTLDTFALPDVLRLLASTKKTGRLLVTGSRGTGSVWVDDGSVVGAEATGTTADGGPVEMVFELLRYPDGGFTFEAGVSPLTPSSPSAVEPLLVDAERLLLEWRDIEAVVPSMDAWVSLVAEIDGDDVLVAADHWKSIVAIGSGASVTSVGHTLKLGELDVCRQVKHLVELGLARVSTTPMPTLGTLETSGWEVEAPAIEPTGTTWDPFAIESSPIESGTEYDIVETVEEPVAEDHGAHFAATPSWEVAPANDALHVVPDVAVVHDVQMDDDVHDVQLDDDDDIEADEVAKQLASLSPRAAQAVAAAAQASTDEERDAALADAADDEEPINRGLLLKFLSSVKS